MRRMFHVFAEKRPDQKNPGVVIEIPVGVAFTSELSSVIRIRLDSIPLNWNGEVLIHSNDPVSELPEKSGGPT